MNKYGCGIASCRPSAPRASRSWNVLRQCAQDNSNMGIKATLSRLNAMLKAQDRGLWYHLEVKTQVSNIYIAIYR